MQWRDQDVRGAWNRSGAHIVLSEVTRVANGGLEDNVIGLDIPVHDVALVQVVHGMQYLAEHRRCCLL